MTDNQFQEQYNQYLQSQSQKTSNSSSSSPQPPSNPQLVPTSIGLYIVLTIITCGIFGWYWLFRMAEDLKILSGDEKATSGGMVVLFYIITFGIYGWYWLFKQGEWVDQVKYSQGYPSSNTGILYLVLAILGLAIISWALLQYEINRMIQN